MEFKNLFCIVKKSVTLLANKQYYSYHFYDKILIR